MSHITISTDRQLRDYCERLAHCRSIGLDTEFVAEHTYRPVLCLIQVVTDDGLAMIDALAVEDMTPFWQMLVRDGHATVVHAGRSEVEFCLQATGQCPAGLLDVQIGAGLASQEYPAGYGSLLLRLLGINAQKHETRTDWRRRPLSPRQIDYAMDDVRHLLALRDVIRARLEALDRLSWLADEMRRWQEEVRRAFFEERWQRMAGISGLSGRGVAIVRQLWRWREAEAQRRDKPARRVLRDDLIIELARRQTDDVKRIAVLRGMERGDLRRHLEEMATCIRQAMDEPAEPFPAVAAREKMAQLSILGQFLFAALGSICREANLAPGLVATPSDVREWISYRLGRHDCPPGQPPLLAQGWRAQVAGQLFDDLLAGKKCVRIGDPAAAAPLVFSENDEKQEN